MWACGVAAGGRGDACAAFGACGRSSTLVWSSANGKYGSSPTSVILTFMSLCLN